MIRLLLCALLIVLPTFSLAAGLPSRPYTAKVLKVVDAGTFVAKISDWPGDSGNVLVKIAYLDTPVPRATCIREKILGKEARKHLIRFLARGGNQVLLSQVVPDRRNNRLIAHVQTPRHQSLAEELIRHELALFYLGGQRNNWCEY